MKKNTLLSILLFPVFMSAQTTILQEDFTTYAGTANSAPAGWYFSSQGNYTTNSSSGTSGPNSYKFGLNNATVITPRFSSGIDSLGFWLKGNGTDALCKLKIYESSDSTNWLVLDSVVPIPTSGTLKKTGLGISTKWLKFIFIKSAGNMAFDDVKILQYFPPVANFSVPPVCKGACSPFSDLSFSSNGSVNKWHWDFGDGSTDTTANPCHLYQNSGTYTTTLIVSDRAGLCDTFIKNTVVYTRPVSSFTFLACGGMDVCYNGNSSSANTVWKWYFGDGANSILQNPQHTFAAAGLYQTCLTVTDTNACSDSVCHTISINNSVIEPEKGKVTGLQIVFANGEVFIGYLPLHSKNTIELIDLNGQVIFQGATGESNYTIRLKNECRGIYLLRVTNEKACVVKKILMD